MVRISMNTHRKHGWTQKAWWWGLMIAAVIGMVVGYTGCGPGTSNVTDGGGTEAGTQDTSKQEGLPGESAEPSTEGTTETTTESITDGTPEKTEFPPQDLSERLPANLSRVGVIRDGKEFIGGPNAVGRERVGDIKIYNSKVAFTIAGKRLTHGYLTLGGKIVAADVIRPEGQPGRSLFQEFSLAFQHRMMHPSEIEIVNDGRDGKAAVVRFIGKDTELGLLLSYIKAFSSELAKETFDLGFHIVNEYRLEPNSEILTIQTTIKNQAPRYRDINFPEVGFFMGDGLYDYFPDKGEVDGPSAIGLWAYHGLMSKDVGYVIFPKAGEDFQILFKYKTSLIGLQNIFTLDAGETLVRTWNIAVGRDLAAAQAAYRRTLPALKTGQMAGKVLQANTKTPLAGMLIHIEQDKPDKTKAYVGQAVSQSDGSFVIELPVGTYLLSVEQAEHLSKPVSVEIKESGNASLDLTAPETGTLVFSSTQEDGKTPLPTKVSIYRLEGGITGVPTHFGRESYNGGAFRIIYPHTGSESTLLPPGKYRIAATRGFFYSVEEKEVVIKSGEESKVTVSLKKWVDTSKAVGGDFHVHAKGSPDSQDSNQLKVASMAGEGLELAVATEHEFVTDYQPYIKDMKLESWIRGVVGEEVTTHFGHFNVYPIPYKADALNYGAFQWYEHLAPGMFQFIESQAPGSVMQINHPRGAAAGSYFSYAGYNPNTGKADVRPNEWSWKFHAIEVFNGKDFSKAMGTTVEDWYSMLNFGYRMTAMGNSDSHRATTSETGYPRNMVMVGHNDPQKLTMEELANTIKKQKVVISAGAMISLSASASGDAAQAVSLGEMITPTNDKVYLHIRVEASPWVHLDKLQIIGNGKVVEEKALPQKPDEVVRFNDKIELSPQKDTWYIVIVTGTKALAPAVPGGMPFALTNPVYVDADKDNKFTPPQQIQP